MGVVELRKKIDLANEEIVIVEIDELRAQSDPDSYQHYADMINLRFRGFEGNYGPLCLPVDNGDYVSSHIVTCLQIQGELIPVSSYRFTKLSVCKKYGMEFPLLTLLKEANADKEHIEEVEKIIAQCEQTGRDIAYCGSWNIHPDYRGKENSKFIRDLVYTTHVNWQKAHNVPELFVCGVVKLNVPKWQQTIGYELIGSNGTELDGVKQQNLFGEEVKLLHLKNHTDHCIDLAKKFQNFWENRITFLPANQDDIKKAA